MNILEEIIQIAEDCITYEEFRRRLSELKQSLQREEDDIDAILNEIRQQG